MADIMAQQAVLISKVGGLLTDCSIDTNSGFRFQFVPTVVRNRNRKFMENFRKYCKKPKSTKNVKFLGLGFVY